MHFIFYAPCHFEPWNWENSITTGIGGSETSTVEMAWRLARRGHDVTVYAPLPDGSPNEWRGTKWLPLSEVDWSLPGWWMLYRCPDAVDNFSGERADQCLSLMMQDWDYPSWTPERVAKLDRIVPLCYAHERWILNRHPEFAGKTWVTRNGIKGDLIEEIDNECSQNVPTMPVLHNRSSAISDSIMADGHVVSRVSPRNPFRMMFASSPDRGLLASLQVFSRVKEFIPEAEFHATYGFNNIDKLIAQGARQFQRYKDRCLNLIEETGATFHGRLTQKQLYREWLKTNVLIYPTTFWETGWITGLEGQALGAIPVYSPIWAQGENTRHGIAVPGNPDNSLTLARFVREVIRLMDQQHVAESIRGPMMQDVRANWDWEQFVWQKPGENWEQAAEQDFAKRTSLVSTA